MNFFNISFLVKKLALVYMISNKDIEKLIEASKDKGINQSDLEKKARYSPGYISRSLKRNSMSERAFGRLQKALEESKEGTLPVDLGKRIMAIEGMCQTILNALAEVLAHQNGGDAAVYHAKLDRILKEYMSSLELDE